MNPPIKIEAIETMPRKRLVGYCAILNDKAVRDYYEKLWVNFIERIQSVPCLAGRELYGVCTNLQHNNFFEYWTTVECAKDDPVPPDLVSLPLDGGIYGSRIERPDTNLPLMYSQKVSTWNAPDDYTLDWRLPFFEVHRPNFFKRSSVKICVPLNFSLNSIYHGVYPPK
ncbi:MAG: GyrI-like domain-containing protein [Deltaproteobacteria bacterium]|jgi:hypothetical protein|nr:GyrI-like domain-containing protein [Deltaproteobacteria bacterium]